MGHFLFLREMMVQVILLLNFPPVVVVVVVMAVYCPLHSMLDFPFENIRPVDPNIADLGLYCQYIHGLVLKQQDEVSEVLSTMQTLLTSMKTMKGDEDQEAALRVSRQQNGYRRRLLKAMTAVKAVKGYEENDESKEGINPECHRLFFENSGEAPVDEGVGSFDCMSFNNGAGGANQCLL